MYALRPCNTACSVACMSCIECKHCYPHNPDNTARFAFRASPDLAEAVRATGATPAAVVVAALRALPETGISTPPALARRRGPSSIYGARLGKDELAAARRVSGLEGVELADVARAALEAHVAAEDLL